MNKSVLSVRAEDKSVRREGEVITAAEVYKFGDLTSGHYAIPNRIVLNVLEFFRQFFGSLYES